MIEVSHMDRLKTRLRIYFIMLVGVMGLGTVGFKITEGLSLEDALYFSIVTITTVGYGDIHPATLAGKWLTIILIITGVGTFLGVVANATEIMLSRRERAVRLQKLHMVTGAFFSDVGTELLELLTEYDPHLDRVRGFLLVETDWTQQEFLRVHKTLKDYDFEVLIVDTNSKDRTREIASSKGARIINEPRRGYGRAYKTGFKNAKGEFIATLDADCTYPAHDSGQVYNYFGFAVPVHPSDCVPVNKVVIFDLRHKHIISSIRMQFLHKM